MKRIVYLHGFNSSPASKKANDLQRRLESLGKSAQFAAPKLHYEPARAIADIAAVYAGCDADEITFVGSSLGGFYATHLTEIFGFKSVLVNPAVAAHLSLEGYVGPQQNLYTGEKYDLTETHIGQLRALAVAKPVRLDRYWLMVETGDETLDYREAVNFYRGARQTVIEGGDHGFQAWQSLLPAVIEFAGL